MYIFGIHEQNIYEVENYIRGDYYEINKANHINVYKSNLRNGLCKDMDGKLWKEIVPIQIAYDALEEGFDGININSIKKIKRNLNVLENFIQDNVALSHRDEMSFYRQLDSRIKQYSNLKKKTYVDQDSFNKLNNAFIERIRDFGDFAGIDCISNYHTSEVKSLVIAFDDDKQILFILGFVLIEDNDSEEYDKYKLNKIDDKANYKWKCGDLVADKQNGQIIPFPSETSVNKHIFEKELSLSISRTLSDDPLFKDKINRCIESNSIENYIIIEFSESDVMKIIRRVETLLSVKIKLEKKRGRKPNDGFNSSTLRYIKISW